MADDETSYNIFDKNTYFYNCLNYLQLRSDGFIPFYLKFYQKDKEDKYQLLENGKWYYSNELTQFWKAGQINAIKAGFFSNLYDLNKKAFTPFVNTSLPILLKDFY